MILKRFYDERLAQASYLIGCGASGQAIVFDPNRDVEQYVDVARAERVKITHVTETHIHADFVSGTRELAARTGAKMLLSAEGGADWQYAFGQEPNAKLLRDGEEFQIGNIRITVWHTPGHTPEHIIFFITDGAAADKPIGVVTGDFVFVGDVGRPDLLEKAARIEGTQERAARELFKSLQRFKELPDYLQIWPGHGAGSACGKGLSAIPHSTIGYERMFNWAFNAANEDAFAAEVLSGQPDPPTYFAQMKRINREGPPVLGTFPHPDALGYEALSEILAGEDVVIDTRLPHQFASRHLPRTINIPLDRSFSTWAGWLVPYDRNIYLVIDRTRPEAVHDAVKALTLIGLDRVRGFFTSAAIDQWAEAGRATEKVPQVRASDLVERIRSGLVNVIDVRNPVEYEAGHIAGVPNIPLGQLTDRLAEVPRDKPLVVHCQSGARSAIATSILQAHGITDVINMSDGYGAWARGGHGVESPAEAAAAHRA